MKKSAPKKPPAPFRDEYTPQYKRGVLSNQDSRMPVVERDEQKGKAPDYKKLDIGTRPMKPRRA